MSEKDYVLSKLLAVVFAFLGESKVQNAKACIHKCVVETPDPVANV